MVTVSTMSEKTDVCEMVERSVSIFVEAVELSSDLEILGTAFPSDMDGHQGGEVFVIRDYTKDEGIEGAYVEVSINEVVEKVTDFDKAQEFLRVISNDRSSIVLNGITRIVGYYSRVNNWNKSKVGELRDRSNGRYGLTNEKSCFQGERLKMIDSL
ncbi:MAG: anaerobic ribonucleoside-triphosphate reductase [Candidatus Scalindua sp.]|nr:anaerobic ribonucleoside-triphosphate reductase [Candidatus Scalindua sp.]